LARFPGWILKLSAGAELARKSCWIESVGSCSRRYKAIAWVRVESMSESGSDLVTDLEVVIIIEAAGAWTAHILRAWPYQTSWGRNRLGG
jgi:hypothetical protein